MSTYYAPWFRSAPMSKEQMEHEIATSLVESGSNDLKFSEADIHELLTALNLTQKYTDARDHSERA